MINSNSSIVLKIFTRACLGIWLLCLFVRPPCSSAWQRAAGPLQTRWAKDVSPKNAHPEYPRPQMTRKDWLNLNGLWDLAITPRDAPMPKQFQTEILVP